MGLDKIQNWVNKRFDDVGASRNNGRSYMESYGRSVLMYVSPLLEPAAGAAKGKKAKDIWADYAGNFRNVTNACFDGLNKTIDVLA